ncbi:MAG: hypothetical protein ACI835_002022 [Planctomycetota bacterium]|jgi:hypothetical protein
MHQACEREVIALHRFFQEWFAGRLPDTPQAFTRFANVLASDFEIIVPDGMRIDRATLLGRLQTAHGSDPESRIWIENFVCRSIRVDLVQTTYEEWQMSDGLPRGRLSSALFRQQSELPEGVEWIHLHECWLA